MADNLTPTDIITYWDEIGPDGWWKKDEKTDDTIRTRFGELYNLVCQGSLDFWLETADGSLAYVIVLDQFSRNMFRDDPRAFAQDSKALAAAMSAIERGIDQTTTNANVAPFFYLPLEHSESILIQNLSLKHMIKTENLAYIDAARWHHEIIKRFGRFPHRNKVLGRHTTPAEQAYLDAGGFKG